VNPAYIVHLPARVGEAFHLRAVDHLADAGGVGRRGPAVEGVIGPSVNRLLQVYRLYRRDAARSLCDASRNRPRERSQKLRRRAPGGIESVALRMVDSGSSR
jgi:hypothetical protein